MKNEIADLTVATQMDKHLYGSDIEDVHGATAGVWYLLGYDEGQAVAKGAEVTSAGTSGTLVVHPVRSVTKAGALKWYNLELTAGAAPKGCEFDAIDLTNSTAATLASCCIILK